MKAIKNFIIKSQTNDDNSLDKVIESHMSFPLGSDFKDFKFTEIM